MTQEDRANLHQIFTLMGWEVLERLFKEEGEKLGGDWLNTNPEEPQKVLAAQAIAHGYHLGVTHVFTRVQEEVHAYRESLKAPKEDLDSEIRSITSPFGGLLEV